MSKNNSENKEKNENQSSQSTQNQSQKRILNSYDELSKKIQSLIDDPKKLQNGYTILCEDESQINFCYNLLKISFESEKEKNKNKKKLSAICFINFLKKNYNTYITNEEILEIVSYFLSNISMKDYFLKNFTAKSLGFIAGKEFPNCYESFIKILLDKLNSNNEINPNENEIDTILKILISVLNECDDACAIITGDVLPVIINIFKISKNNQKNREKCLIIISLVLNKLSYAGGNDIELLEKSLDKNSLMENSISLFT
jgi:hypothetical protein